MCQSRSVIVFPWSILSCTWYGKVSSKLVITWLFRYRRRFVIILTSSRGILSQNNDLVNRSILTESYALLISCDSRYICFLLHLASSRKLLSICIGILVELPERAT